MVHSQTPHHWLRVVPGLSGLLGVAAMLRFYGLDRHGLWLDETIQYQESLLSLGRLYSGVFPQELFLSFIIGHGLHVLGAGESIWMLRFPHAVVGVLTVGAVWLLAREVFGRFHAWMAGATAGLMPVLIAYSQEYRFYCLFGLLACAGWWALAVALRTNRTEWWLSYVAIALLNLYNHHLAVVCTASQGVFAGVSLILQAWPLRDRGMLRIWDEAGSRLRALVMVAALLLVGYLPAVPFVARMLEEEAAGKDSGRLLLNFDTLALLFGTYPGFGRGWLMFAMTILAATGFGFAVKKRPIAAWLSGIAIAMPLTVFVFVGGNRVTFNNRYLIFLYPVLALLIGAGVAVLMQWSLQRVRALNRSAALRAWARPDGVVAHAGGIALLVVLMAPAVARQQATNPKPLTTDVRSAYAFILAQVGPDDVLLEATTPEAGDPVWFAHYDAYYLRDEVRRFDFEKECLKPALFLEKLPRLLARTGRLFVVVTHTPSESETLLDVIGDAFEATTFEGIMVLRESSARPPPMRTQVREFLEKCGPRVVTAGLEEMTAAVAEKPSG